VAYTEDTLTVLHRSLHPIPFWLAAVVIGIDAAFAQDNNSAMPLWTKGVRVTAEGPKTVSVRTQLSAAVSKDSFVATTAIIPGLLQLFLLAGMVWSRRSSRVKAPNQRGRPLLAVVA
jgi:hypothetical protein